MPDDNFVVVLMEAPNYSYLDQASKDVNNIAILDSNNFHV